MTIRNVFEIELSNNPENIINLPRTVLRFTVGRLGCQKKNVEKKSQKITTDPGRELGFFLLIIIIYLIVYYSSAIVPTAHGVHMMYAFTVYTNDWFNLAKPLWYQTLPTQACEILIFIYISIYFFFENISQFNVV